MVFRPAGSDHAIVSNSFTITLATPVDREVVSALRAARSAWTDSLPAIRELRGVELQLQLDGSAQLKQSPGLEFAFLRPDGTSTWALRIDQSDVIVECNLYTRWAQVWKQASLFLATALEALSADRPAVKSFTMQVLDRFETDNFDDDTAQIFSDGWPLSAHMRDKRHFWHQHLGWLETTSAGELLQNVNIDVLPKETSDPKRTKVANFLHLQRLQFAAPALAGLKADQIAAALSEVTATMHERNKELLRSALTAEVSKLIQLDGGT